MDTSYRTKQWFKMLKTTELKLPPFRSHCRHRNRMEPFIDVIAGQLVLLGHTHSWKTNAYSWQGGIRVASSVPDLGVFFSYVEIRVNTGVL